MQIDWFTLGAQVFNFILLAILLWFVLYRPVREAVDEREEEIESRVESAREEKEEAESLMEEHRRKKAELEEKRDSLIREAEEEAEERRKELKKEIREEMEKARNRWRESLRQEREAFLLELSRRVREEAFQVMSRGLADLIQAGAPEAMAATFLQRARETPEEDREAFSRAVAGAQGRCTLQSSLEIPEESREEIRDLLQDWARDAEENGDLSVSLELEVEEDGPRGLELWAGDRKLAWTVESYVEELKEEVAGVLDSEAGSRTGGGDGTEAGAGTEADAQGKEEEEEEGGEEDEEEEEGGGDEPGGETEDTGEKKEAGGTREEAE